MILHCCLAILALPGLLSLDNAEADARSSDYDRASRAIEAAASGPGGLSVLLAGLESRNVHVRIEALDAIGNGSRGKSAAIQGLVKYLGTQQGFPSKSDLPGIEFHGKALSSQRFRFKPVPIPEFLLDPKDSKRRKKKKPEKRKPSKRDDPEGDERIRAVAALAAVCKGSPTKFLKTIDKLEVADDLLPTQFTHLELAWNLLTISNSKEKRERQVLLLLGDSNPSRQLLGLSSATALGPDHSEGNSLILGLVRSDSERVRYQALQALVFRKAAREEAAVAAAEGLDDPSEAVRAVAHRIWLWTSTEVSASSAEVALHSLEHSDVNIVRHGIACVEPLLALDPGLSEALLPALISVLKSKEPANVRAATRSLGGVGPPAKKAVRRLRSLAKSRDKTTAEFAKKAIELITAK